MESPDLASQVLDKINSIRKAAGAAPLAADADASAACTAHARYLAQTPAASPDWG